MNLVVDIGNTRTKAGWFENGKLVKSARYTGFSLRNLDTVLRDAPADAILISSVGEEDRITFRQPEKAGIPVFFLNVGLQLPIKINYSTPQTLGHDRIAAAAGAWSIFPGSPLLVIDMGTAITIDFVSPEGEYRGGNISPGLSTRFESLHEHTARLPRLQKNSAFPEFGRDTDSAIEAGVQQGIVFELNGYMEVFGSRYPSCKTLLTGGDADFFADHLKKPIFVFPDLVLTGLNEILTFNMQK
jgi:type III pantothenate kinase